MTVTRQPVALPAVSHAHRQRLLEIVDDLRRADYDAAQVALLDTLAAQLPQLRATLPPAARATLDQLDTNESALRAALAGTTAALHAYQALPISAQLLIDPAALGDLAEAAQQLAMAAGELALRAQARAALLHAPDSEPGRWSGAERQA